MAGTYFGYILAFIHIIISIAYYSTWGKVFSGAFFTPTTIVNIVRYGRILIYGLWAFIVPFVNQLYLSRSDVRRIIPTFGIYIFFIILMTIGITVCAVRPTTVDNVQSVMVATYLPIDVFGMFTLYIAIIAGHAWTSTASEERDSEKYEV